MLFSGLTLYRLAVGQRFAQNAPLAQLFNPHKAKAVPVAAQFNEIVSEGPKSAWGKPLRPAAIRIQLSSLFYPNTMR